MQEDGRKSGPCGNQSGPRRTWFRFRLNPERIADPNTRLRLRKDFEPYGSTNVLIRFGSSWVAMRATSLNVFVSMADTVFSAELVT
jgi:hypothetical protein